MKKKAAIASICVMVLVFVIGIILILSSVDIGQGYGNDAMRRNGGSMDTSSYERIIESNITNYRLVGLLLSSLGGMGILLSSYFLYKEL